MESKTAGTTILFSQEQKDELDERKEKLKAGNSKVYSVEESIQRAQMRVK